LFCGGAGIFGLWGTEDGSVAFDALELFGVVEELFGQWVVFGGEEEEGAAHVDPAEGVGWAEVGLWFAVEADEGFGREVGVRVGLVSDDCVHVVVAVVEA
jgi:hypothetical protein